MTALVTNRVVIPYVEGMSEKSKRIYFKHETYQHTQKYLSPPKGQKEIIDNSDVVYDGPCGGCEKSYIGETGRQFGICLKEHQKYVEKIVDKKSPEPQEKLHK